MCGVGVRRCVGPFVWGSFMKFSRVLVLSAIVLLLSACGRGTDGTAGRQSGAPAEEGASKDGTTAKKAAAVDAARLTAAADDGANWMSYGRTYDEQRFSPLKQIDASTVPNLKLAWHYDLDSAHRVQEATPLVIDGVMYVSSAWSK